MYALWEALRLVKAGHAWFGFDCRTMVRSVLLGQPTHHQPIHHSGPNIRTGSWKTGYVNPFPRLHKPSLPSPKAQIPWAHVSLAQTNGLRFQRPRLKDSIKSCGFRGPTCPGPKLELTTSGAAPLAPSTRMEGCRIPLHQPGGRYLQSLRHVHAVSVPCVAWPVLADYDHMCSFFAGKLQYAYQIDILPTSSLPIPCQWFGRHLSTSSQGLPFSMNLLTKQTYC